MLDYGYMGNPKMINVLHDVSMRKNLSHNRVGEGRGTGGEGKGNGSDKQDKACL